MSGHSHAKTVMRTKQASDAKRSQIFSKLAKELTVAAKEGGADPTANPRLRSVIEKAREANMPADNIDRAVKKATGGDAGNLEEVLFEAYGPGNVALLITGITDNKNRTLGEVKQILQKNQGKMVEGGAVRWLFERRGVIAIDTDELQTHSKEDIELQVIEAGAQDLYWDGNILEAYVDPSALSSLKDALATQGIPAQSSLDWVPKDRVTISLGEQEATEKLLEALDDQDDVQSVYSNL